MRSLCLPDSRCDFLSGRGGGGGGSLYHSQVTVRRKKVFFSRSDVEESAYLFSSGECSDSVFES